MAGTTNPTDVINGAPNSTATGTYTPETTLPPGATGTQANVPSSSDLLAAFWARYNTYNQALQNGPEDPNYFAAKNGMPALESQLSKMVDLQTSLDAKKATADAKPTPSADQPFPGGWDAPQPDGTVKHVDGTWGQYATWEKTTNEALAQQTKDANERLKALQTQYTNDIASGKLATQQAQDNYTNALNDYKAQLSPMVSALGAARDVADMTLRGPVIPALLQNMAPAGTNAAIVGMINGTPGVTKIPASSGLGQDQPLPVDINTLGTQIAQTALKTFGPWAQQASQQARGGVQIPTGSHTGTAGAPVTPPQGNPITNSQPNQPHYMAPTAGAPTGSMPAPPIMSGPSGAPSSLMNNGAALPPNGLPAGAAGGLMMGPGGYTAGIDPQTGAPLAMH